MTREVAYNPTGKVRLTDPQKAAAASVFVSMQEVTGVASSTVKYVALLAWRDKRLQIEITSGGVPSHSKAELKMWTNGGWQKCVSLPPEEVPDWTWDPSITVDDFETPHTALVERAMAVLA